MQNIFSLLLYNKKNYNNLDVFLCTNVFKAYFCYIIKNNYN